MNEKNDYSNLGNSEPGSDKQNNISFESLAILLDKFKDGTIKEVYDDWKWIFSYSKRYTGVIIYYTIMGIVSTVLGLISSVISKYLIDIITGYQTDKLWVLILLEVISIGANLTIGNFLGRMNLKISIDIGNDIQADIFDKIIDSDWLALNEYSNGDLLNRFSADVGTVSANAITWFPTIIVSIFNFVATFILIFHYDVTMAWIAFASAPFLLLMSRFLIKKQRYYQKKVREMSSEVMSFEVETFYNTDTIKSFGVAGYYEEKLRWWQREFKMVQLEMNMFSIKTGIAMSLVTTGVALLAFYYCLYLLWSHKITYGTMTLFLSQRSNLSSAFSGVVGIIPSFLSSAVSAHRVRELVELPKEQHIAQSAELYMEESSGYTVRMKEVSFSYVENNEVIHGADFEANPGEIVALIGPSGQGKTTMIRLILGLIRPGSGCVSIISKSKKSVEANVETRRYFAYVPQGNTILSGTIAQNLRVVKEDATDDEIKEALECACAWEFVKDIPGGINAKVGERGRGFSEGQAQRLSIARALLRDAPVLLLDEATSALDTRTEQQVLENIIKRRPDKTIIVTTHRPSVLSMCNRVYKVENGCVTY